MNTAPRPAGSWLPVLLRAPTSTSRGRQAQLAMMHPVVVALGCRRRRKFDSIVPKSTAFAEGRGPSQFLDLLRSSAGRNRNALLKFAKRFASTTRYSGSSLTRLSVVGCERPAPMANLNRKCSTRAHRGGVYLSDKDDESQYPRQTVRTRANFIKAPMASSQ